MDRATPQREVQLPDSDLWQKYRWYVLGASFVLVAQATFISLLLVQRGHRQRAEHERMRTRAALRRSYRREQHLARRLISAQEQERARIARELQDDVNQQVAALAIALSAIRLRMTGVNRDVRVEVERLQKHTTALVETVRGLSHDLHPGTLLHARLEPTIRGLCREVGRRHSLRIRPYCAPDLGELPDDIALTLYRVVQESLRNVVQHAHARRVLVRVQRPAERVDLQIVDDGEGFRAPLSANDGLGLISLEQRVRLSGGRMRVNSRLGRGTSVRVRIPLRPLPTEQTVGLLQPELPQPH